MEEIAAGMQKIVPKMDLILSSPLVRAWQTAEIVAKAYGMKNSFKLRETAALAPDSKFDSLLAELEERADEKHVLLVGHHPHLGDLIAYFIARGFARNIPLKKGGLACLEIDPKAPRSSCTFHWLLTPKHLKLLARAK